MKMSMIKMSKNLIKKKNVNEHEKEEFVVNINNLIIYEPKRRKKKGMMIDLTESEDELAMSDIESINSNSRTNNKSKHIFESL